MQRAATEFPLNADDNRLTVETDSLGAITLTGRLYNNVIPCRQGTFGRR